MAALTFLHVFISNLESSDESSNFAILSYVISDIVTKYLRKHFTTKWDETHHDQPWTSDTESGSRLISEIEGGIKRKNKLKGYRKRLENGNESEWDIMLLLFIMLDCGLQMFTGSEKDVEKFGFITKSQFSKACRKSCSSSRFDNSMGEIKRAAKNTFGSAAADEIEEYKLKKQNVTGSNGKQK